MGSLGIELENEILILLGLEPNNENRNIVNQRIEEVYNLGFKDGSSIKTDPNYKSNH